MRDAPVCCRKACWLALVFVLIVLLTGGAYYTSDIRCVFRNYGQNFLPSQSVVLAILPAVAKQGGGLYIYGYSIQESTDAVSLRLNVDDPAYEWAVITNAYMYPATNGKKAIELTSDRVLVFQPLTYHIQRMDAYLAIKRFAATCQFPVNLDTNSEGYSIDIQGYYLLNDGRKLQFRLLDFVKLARRRSLVPMFRKWADC